MLLNIYNLAMAQRKLEVEKISDRITVVKIISEDGSLNVSAITTKSGINIIDTGINLIDARNSKE